MVGNSLARSSRPIQPWSRRAFSLLLSIALILSLTPLPALASERATDVPADVQSAQAEASAAVLAAEPEPAADKSSVQHGPTTEIPAAEPEPATEVAPTTLSWSTTGEVATAELAESALADASLAKISRNEKPFSVSALSGFLQRNETLYAVAWTEGKKRVDAEPSWTYEWLVGSTTSGSDFAPIEGETRSSLTLTDDLRTKFANKYLRVRISCGDISVEGPKRASTYKTLTACGPIKAPVPAKTALDEKSYVLLQPTADETSTLTTIAAASLKVGATLCANVYDSEASPAMRIAAQDRWTYQWLASDSKEASDSEFQPIEGATSASFIITDELATKLAGKYIRVRIEGDDQTLYGPSGSFYTPSSTSYDTPGPVVAPGQIKLDYILLSWNGGGFGNDLESVPNCNVGDVLEACAYDFDDPYTLYGEDDAEFSWQVGDTKYGDFEEVSQGATYTAPEELSGRYLKVVATAKNGIPGSATCETEPGKVLPKGVSTLYRAEDRKSVV